MRVSKFKAIIFLRDVMYLALTSFGGPQAHIAHFQKHLVAKRKYISEAELSELYAICQILPGPTSTQTIAAIGYKLGGARLAYLTLLIWAMPSVAVMTLAGILIGRMESKDLSLEFTRYIQPMAVGFVFYAAYAIGIKSVITKSGIGLMVFAAVAAYFIKVPYVFPVTLLIAGAVTAIKYKAQPKEEKKPVNLRWNNFMLWAGVLILAAVIGGLTKSLPILLFENFYRNGSLIFGGGQVLTPMLYTEFVQYLKPVADGVAKPYVSAEEFLSGLALTQSIPGPLFSFSAFLGTLAMHSREYGLTGQIIGAIFSAAGIFLPGTFLIFFMIRVYESLKAYRPIRASLEGISAANAGLVTAGAILLFQPLDLSALNIATTIITFLLLAFTRIPSWMMIPSGLLLGIIL
jgi:chromate transporter